MVGKWQAAPLAVGMLRTCVPNNIVLWTFSPLLYIFKLSDTELTVTCCYCFCLYPKDSSTTACGN